MYHTSGVISCKLHSTFSIGNDFQGFGPVEDGMQKEGQISATLLLLLITAEPAGPKSDIVIFGAAIGHQESMKFSVFSILRITATLYPKSTFVS